MVSLLDRLATLFGGTARPVPRSAAVAPRIFISYRRADSAGIAGRIYDRLSAHFGVECVFMDIGGIPLGVDFVTALTEEISQCSVVLALIGSAWLTRIAEADDFVQAELQVALAQGKVVVPVLLDDTQMPSAQDLPPNLRELAYRNAIWIGSVTSFHRDLDILIASLERLPPPEDTLTPQEPSAVARPNEITVDKTPRGRVFLSHSSLDREWVEGNIVTALTDAEIPSWYARTAIRTASQWEREILKGMEGCGWFLLVASPQSASSEWVKDEVFWAMQHRPSNIITAIMQTCDLYSFHLRLARLQHIDFQANGILEAKQSMVRTILSNG